MRAYDIIAKKRDKKALSKDEINFFINGYTAGDIADYQASALLMAIYLNGMTPQETVWLTYAMACSGEMIDLSEINGIKVDKHSTGGVGDKTTLIVAPVIASLKIPFAKMSGRGLGHTGGTIDKLESIPGFSASLSSSQFIDNVKNAYIALTSQSANLTPADRKLYSLRDSTATVSCIPLIASSIISKKIAGGADKILLDVKTGTGAFMKTFDESLELAKEMVMLGKNLGRQTVALISDMDKPLGNNIGNSLEVIEAIETLKGRGPADLWELCDRICIQMIIMAKGCTQKEARQMIEHSIKSGSALDKFKEFIIMQNGDDRVIDDYSVFSQAKYEYPLIAVRSGFIGSMHAESIGRAAMILGAGREKKEDNIDPAAGICLYKKTGDYVEKDTTLAMLYTNKPGAEKEALKILGSSIKYSDNKSRMREIVLAMVTASETIVYGLQKN